MSENENENIMTHPIQQPSDIEPVSRVLQRPGIVDLKPRITVFGVGGGGSNAVNNMIKEGLDGVEFVVANTDAQSLEMSRAKRKIQLGVNVTRGLGAGSNPEIGQAAAEECIHEIMDHIDDSHMVFITCGMGGGTGTGAAPVIARAAREQGKLTVGVVTKPFNYEQSRRMKIANAGIDELQKYVDTLIVIPNQNLFRIIDEKTSMVDALAMADHVLYAGVASITDLMVREGLINLDFADVRSVMLNMGRAMMGTGEASGEGRAMAAAEAAINNPLLDESSMRGARGLLISITGGRDMTLNEVDLAVTRVCDEMDPEANVIFGAIIDEALEGLIRISVVATGIDNKGEGAVYSPMTSSINQPVKTGSTASESSGVSAITSFHSDIMEALEEEVAETLEDAFRPQSQLFGQDPANNQDDEAMGRKARRESVTPTTAMKTPLPRQHPETISNEFADKVDEVRSPVPDLEDFPPSIQQAFERKLAADDEIGHGPRRLWQKLTQGFIQRDEDEIEVRLEPAELADSMENSLQNSASPVSADAPMVQPDLLQSQQPRQTLSPERVQQARQAVAAPKIEDELTEDEWEIPPFLRRQVN